jgi:archaemetzincin
MKIILEQIGSINGNIMETLRSNLSAFFGCPVEIRQNTKQIDVFYVSDRNQYSSSMLLSSLENAPGEGEKEARAVGITDIDLYTRGLNFVFGQASSVAGTAIVSLCRLREEFYGSAPDEVLLLKRALKEIVHELGHTFGLAHCTNPGCIMHFSGCLADTDRKELLFCPECRPMLGM